MVMLVMLHSVIVASKTRDTPDDFRDDFRGDGMSFRRLNARSLALSALLGTHPPVLPARSLVALAELFGIAGGTMRTALSRMAAQGEIRAVDGRYHLAGRLLERQQTQDIGRRPPDPAWDGRWHTVVAADDQRDVTDRRRFRVTLTDHRFGELRPDTWLRPANLPAPDLGPTAIVVTGTLDRAVEPALVARLWDLASLADTAQHLVNRIDRHCAGTDLTAPASIPATFTLSAAIVRFLRSEPLLPSPLTPADWPVDQLRHRYDDLERDLQTTLRGFLRSARG